jgi:membrane fusion protein (multidrug efflux system)
MPSAGIRFAGPLQYLDPMRSFALLSALALAACGDKQAAAPAGAPQAPEVGVITLEAKPVTLTRELPGRTSAFRVAEVRARVNGIVQKRLFTEGSDVKEGQPLFRIDAAPYQAALESARAGLARAEAAVATRRLAAQRFGELLESNAVSRQEHDDAVAALRGAEADVAAGRAAVRTARINLDYTTVVAPIAGRIGRAEVTEGAYVQQAGATLLATVQQIDPIHVDLAWSSAEALRLRRDLESGKLAGVEGGGEVRLALSDGGEYPEPGKLQFTDITVDPSTGSISVRALFPNPRGELLPGLFVRARIAEGTRPQAILVPQRAVQRDASGRAHVLVVTRDKKVERRAVETDRVVGDAWLVTSGLAAGESVIVDGLQKARPGAPVVPVPSDRKQAAR